MESIIIVLHLLSHFFSRVPAGFPHVLRCPSDCGFLKADTRPLLSYTLGTQVRRKLSKKYSTACTLKSEQRKENR